MKGAADNPGLQRRERVDVGALARNRGADMSHEDFDVEGLAAYLHLPAAKIARMAERGHLPGRRIGGQWRFSAADIHHWWEQRFESLDDEQLAAAEGVLGGNTATASENIAITDLLPVEAVAIPLDARTRNAAMKAIIHQAAQTGWLWDEAKMAEAVQARELLHSTALDNGVALLHPRRPLPSILAQPFLALGVTRQGLPFGHASGVLTDIFFLICSTDDRTHLRVLARLSRLIGDANILHSLRTAEDARSAWQVIADGEAKLASTES